MADFFIKQNDTSPLFQVTLLDAAGSAVDYTGASSVRFHMVNRAGQVVIDADATQTTPASGVVTYEWQAADTATGGFFDAEIEITFAGGAVQTFPNYGYWKVQVSEDLA